MAGGLRAAGQTVAKPPWQAERQALRRGRSALPAARIEISAAEGTAGRKRGDALAAFGTEARVHVEQDPGAGCGGDKRRGGQM